ncbi:MAG TPA: hypothetical protein VFB80_20830 [Pirellulaceae bacterium]|nr:hypothetical protein [Pirellulaceae bacterium]
MSDSPNEALPRRGPPAHWIVAILALAGAGAVQVNWGAALGGPAAAGLWPYSIAALVAATAWLLSTAWLHWRLVARRPAELHGHLRRLMTLALSELLVASFAALLLWQGHGSRVLLAGLWTVPPVLLVVAAISSAALLAAAGSGAREVSAIAPNSLEAAPPSDRWRTVIVLALLISLGLLALRPLPEPVHSSRFEAKQL